jgi:hypothetical protein
MFHNNNNNNNNNNNISYHIISYIYIYIYIYNRGISKARAYNRDKWRLIVLTSVPLYY